MKHYTTDIYRIEIYPDPAFADDGEVNLTEYDLAYLNKSEYYFPSVFGIKVFEGNVLIKSAVIGSNGGATAIHDTSTIIEKNRFLICCSDTIFCLSVPDLKLLWRTQADQSTCFQIYKYQDGYIVHGETEISRLDKDGKILWQQSGADIFTTIEGKDNFSITGKYILVTDWGNRKYKFDFDGQLIV